MEKEKCQCKECKELRASIGRGHYSDCAVHNEPAEPNGECNCMPKITPEWKQKQFWMDCLGIDEQKAHSLVESIKTLEIQSQEEARKEGDAVEMVEVWVPVEKGGEAVMGLSGQRLKRVAMLLDGKPIFADTGVTVQKWWLTKEEANALSTSEEEEKE